MRLLAVFATVALLLLPTASRSSEVVFPWQNEVALKGLRAFDVHLQVALWMHVDRDKQAIVENGQREFELALRRERVRVENDSSYVLVCQIGAVSFEESKGLVFYSSRLMLFDTSKSPLAALLWESSWAGVIGEERLTHSTFASSCSSRFLNAWMKHNFE